MAAVSSALNWKQLYTKESTAYYTELLHCQFYRNKGQHGVVSHKSVATRLISAGKVEWGPAEQHSASEPHCKSGTRSGRWDRMMLLETTMAYPRHGWHHGVLYILTSMLTSSKATATKSILDNIHMK